MNKMEQVERTIHLDKVINNEVARKAGKQNLTPEEWIERFVVKECVRQLGVLKNETLRGIK